MIRYSDFDIEDEILEATKSDDQLRGQIAFQLFREVTEWAIKISGTGYAKTGQQGKKPTFPRNQAICVGHLVKIAKFMASVTKLSDGEEHGETAIVLIRCIGEAAVNLQYLLIKNDDGLFDRFVEDGFSAEKELYDLILSNVEKRNGSWLGIERNMMDSILRYAQESGIDISNLPRARRWGEPLKNKMETLGLSELYLGMERIPSHAVHGTWVELLMRHLTKLGNEF